MRIEGAAHMKQKKAIKITFFPPESTRVLNPNTPSVAAFIPIINTLSPESPYICRHNTPSELSGTVVLPSHKPLAIGLFRVKMTTLEIRQVKGDKCSHLEQKMGRCLE